VYGGKRPANDITASRLAATAGPMIHDEMRPAALGHRPRFVTEAPGK
jgi:hypothetical protein